jgi:hypothetical protein
MRTGSRFADNCSGGGSSDILLTPLRVVVKQELPFCCCDYIYVWYTKCLLPVIYAIFSLKNSYFLNVLAF